MTGRRTLRGRKTIVLGPLLFLLWSSEDVPHGVRYRTELISAWFILISLHEFKLMTLVNCVVILALGLCVWTTPLRVGVVFGGLLLWGTLSAGQISSVLGLVGFIIYVGGALVLFRYCFILTPLLDSAEADGRVILVGLLVSGSVAPSASSTMYEFYWRAGLLLCVGALLFLVIISVVAMVDLTGGSLRPLAE